MASGGPLVSPILIGRAREITDLCASIEAARSGQGGLTLVAGEAGIGKSRLVTEALGSPASTGCRSIRVACLESDLSEPYALVLEIAHAAGDRRFDIGDRRAPEAERQIRGVQHALQNILSVDSVSEPVILVTEDLHWSDSASLDVLLALVQRPGKLLVLATYRHDEVTPDLAGFLTQASRTREILLEPLERTDVARMIQFVLELEVPVPGALLDEVMTATGGIPFLIEETIRTWSDSGAIERDGQTWHLRTDAALQVPRSVRHAIDARLERQDPLVVRTAELAAVFGDRLRFEFLAQVCDLDNQELSRTLRHLRELHILVPHPDGTFGFRHGLTSQALLARLLEPERRSLHGRVAELLETRPEVAPGMIAQQWARAGEIARAAPYALRAAERAASLHAHREAISHYELAQAGLDRPAPELLVAIGDSHEALGETDEALAWYREAKEYYASRQETGRVAELELRIGSALAHDRRRSVAIEHLEFAFRSLPHDHPDLWKAGLQLALQFAAMGRYDHAERALSNTLDTTGETDQLARLRVNYELAGLRALRGNWQELTGVANQVLRDIRDNDDSSLALRHDAHAASGTVSYYRGHFEAAARHFTNCLSISERRGLINDQALARWNLATNAYYNLGYWEESRAELAKLQALGGLPLAESAGWFEWWLDGRWERALDAWLEAWQVFASMGDLEALTAHGRRIADIFLTLSRPREALELLDPVLERVRGVRARSFEAQLLPREAEALVRIKEHERALSVCDAGLELARDLGARPCEALLLRARALAHRSTSAWAEAFDDCEAAIAILTALPMPYEAARTLREAGLIRLARGRRGDRERAASYLRRAEQLFGDLGASRDEAGVAGILSAAGLAGPAERGPGPLTAREREVAALVTSGMSNREIAERLFITEKTAAYHVSQILNKLDFESRSQIAAYVTRKAAASSEPVS